jgi:chromosome partition protein MukF
VPSPRRAPEDAIAVVADRRLSIELGTVHVCFLVALYVRAEGANLTSFTESQLEEVFVQAIEAVEPGADHVRRRATHAIQHLRAQRMLARVDGQGVVRTGEFALSRLATGIVEFFLEEDVLTRESLVLLTSGLRTAIAGILEAARAATNIPGAPEHRAEAFREGVTGPLRITVSELVAGIERRQRGLDLQQESFQIEIRKLLEADWFGAIERCQSLLTSTSATLQELNDVLLRESSLLLALLHDIEETAVLAGEPDAEAAAQRLVDQVDRIAAWGSSRQRAWSEYFQYVHRYLRDVVRLDPTRALTQRLREQLAGGGRRFALAHAGAPPIQILRLAPVPQIRPPVVRPRGTWDREPVPETAEDPQAVLEGKVQRALDGGASSLSSVTERITEELPGVERFVEAGRVANTVTKLARVSYERERPWVAVAGTLEIEDWNLARAVKKDAT